VYFTRLEKVAALSKATRQVLISRANRAVVTKDKWSVDLATYLRESNPGYSTQE
jgi:hypothetical protein